MGLIESIRRWIDGETTDDILEEADEHSKPRRVWEEFLVKIAREVEACMQREMFTPPGGPTYIPREYIVYLSNDDDKEWQGDKRRGLEQGLFHVLSERARECVRQNVVQITKAEITIGRGSRTISVDLPLKGDPEISRVHATLMFDDQGRYWITAKGRNPTLISGREIPREQRTIVQPDEKMGICSFTLRIQPK